jgi:aminodeoxyfutalosine deaminase
LVTKRQDRLQEQSSQQTRPPAPARPGGSESHRGMQGRAVIDAAAAAWQAPELVILADLVFPVDEAPIEDGCVWISGGRIARVGRRADLEGSLPAGAPIRRFPGSAVIPGLINTHSHLELSSMQGRIPRPTLQNEDFTDWIKHVLAIRESWGPADFDASVRFGTRLLVESGTTTIGDVTASGTSLLPLIESGLRAVVFREVLGFGAEREERAHTTCEEWLNRSEASMAGSRGRVSLALSPHAPHSTSPAIYQDCVRMAAGAGALISTHVSETRTEIELIERGTGRFRDLLAFRGLPMDAWATPGVSPLRYLEDLGVLAAPGLAIHVNYLEPGDLDVLSRSCLVPTFCPQSHRFFGHINHPAAQILEHGIPLVLGTDSLASNDNLDMLEEMRLIQKLFPQIAPSRWLNCATLEAARALQMDLMTGSLTVGKHADLAVVQLSAEERPAGSPLAAAGGDLASLLLAPRSHVVATMIAGEWLFDATAPKS